MPSFKTQHQEFVPPEELQNSIKCFWYDKRDLGAQPASFEVLPDGSAEIIFHFGGGCNLLYKDRLLPIPSPFIMGLLDQPVHIHTRNRLEILGIRCFPWTVFDLLGLPSGKEKVHIFEHPIAWLQPLLNEYIQAGKTTEALTLLEQYFLEMQSQVPVDSLLSKAGIALQKAKGILPVSQVAAAAHATIRTLERKFKQSSGYTVKDVSALMRFEQVRNQLWLKPDTGLAGLAAELGYTDQSHLSREFKRYSGVTPGAFARKAKKDRQAVSSDFVAFVQA